MNFFPFSVKRIHIKKKEISKGYKRFCLVAKHPPH